MAPKTPGKIKNLKENNRKLDPALRPGKLAIPAPSNPPDDLAHVDCEDVQANEIDVLQAIFMDDFLEKKLKSAWNKTPGKAFDIKIKSLNDANTFVTLSVTLTITYPKTPPIIHVAGLEALTQNTRSKITNILGHRPRELVGGEPMIATIAEEITEVLDEAVRAREQGVLPSLEDERRLRQTAAEQHAKEAEVASLKRIEAAQAESDRMEDQMVQQKIERRNIVIRSAESRSPVDDTDITNNDVRFDQAISLPNMPDFSTVTLVSVVHSIGDNGIFIATPKISGRMKRSTDMLAVRQVRVTLPSRDNASWEPLLGFEKLLGELKGLRHANIINIYAFNTDRDENEGEVTSIVRTVSILTDLGNRGNLAEMLEDGQPIPSHKARSWSLELLEALQFYHSQGVVHKRVHARNILFTRSTSGALTLKLADAAYEDRLLELQGRPTMADKGKKLDAWLAPEVISTGVHTRKSDIWDFGVLLIQMLFGTSVTHKHSSPSLLLDSFDLSETLSHLLHKIFDSDVKARPNAFDLLANGFFRSSDLVISGEQPTSRRKGRTSSHVIEANETPSIRRLRQGSFSTTDGHYSHSRYINDFTELRQLGKGGFGVVVVARGKIDLQTYAIKKIKNNSREQLDAVLREVLILRQLEHPSVVRYWHTWIEDDFSDPLLSDDDSEGEGDEEADEPTTTSKGTDAEYGYSSRGLDFASSQGDYIAFGDDTDEGGNEDGGESDSDNNYGTTPSARSLDASLEAEFITSSGNSSLRRTRTRRNDRSILYIQMKLYENVTLRDIIRGNIQEKPLESWRMLRHILEGLAYIHRKGLIHRDLKPENIFIDNGNPVIGDFGLATMSRESAIEKVMTPAYTGEDMTNSIGTALYVAPEINAGSGNYDSKVDMYSLGIMFFEMCHSLPTAMERIDVISKLRERKPKLPQALQEPAWAAQRDIILSLVKHAPIYRPSAEELLENPKIPVDMENVKIHQIQRELIDPESQWRETTIKNLFTLSQAQHISGRAWDEREEQRIPSIEEVRVRNMSREVIHSILRCHGAEEVRRPLLLPRSSVYTEDPVVHVLDRGGTLLQLPYDLILPHARQIARQAPTLPVEKTFVFGEVYRTTSKGEPPRSHRLIEFNIVAKQSRDLRMHEAECLKAIDEIVDATPAFSSVSVCFLLNHWDLLDLVLEYCRIDRAKIPAVKATLTELNFGQCRWTDIRKKLRSSQLDIHSTSLDELAHFDFRETPEKIHDRLQTIFEATPLASRVQRSLEMIQKTIKQMKLLGIKRKVYISPLSCLNERLFSDSIVFQCITDQKMKTLLASGGRYDQLVKDQRPSGRTESNTCHAVGVTFVWEALMDVALLQRKNITARKSLKKTEENLPSVWTSKRCDILVTSADVGALHTACVKLLSTLWSARFSAELATDRSTVDDLLSRQLETSHTWILVVKHEAASTIKVWNTITNVETEVPGTNILHHLRTEMKEREQNLGVKNGAHPALLRQHSHHTVEDEKAKTNGNVHVLFAQHKSKKSNKYQIVGAAKEAWGSALVDMRDAPLLAIETKDDVLHSIRETRLSDGESWRIMIQNAPVGDRKYLNQVHEWLDGAKNKQTDAQSGGVAGVYNLRTGTCISYDLGG